MLTTQTMCIGMLLSITEQLQSAKVDVETTQLKYLCDRMLHSYLTGKGEEQREACESMFKTIEELEMFLEQQKELLRIEFKRLDSQVKQD